MCQAHLTRHVTKIACFNLIITLIMATLAILLSFNCSYADVLSAKASATQRLKTIIVNNYHPYTFVNDKGQPDGFSVEIAKAVAKAMDIELDIRADKWDTAMQELETGNIDLLPMMAYSPERDEIFDFSVPHTIAYDVVFTRKGTTSLRTLKNLSGKTVVVMNKDIAHSYLLSSGLSKTMTIHLVDSLPEAMKQLVSGIGDAAIMPKLVGLVIAKRLNLSGIETSPHLINNYTRPFSFAVKDGNQALLERLNQGLNIIKNSGEYDAIYKKWFGAYEEPHVNWKEFIKYGLVIFLIFLGFLIWNILLKRQVKVKTEHLEKEIAERKSTEESLRKSEERFQLATRAATVGIWDWDVVNNILIWDDSMYSLYGIRKEDFSGVFETWSNMVPPEDRQYAESEIQAALNGEREYDIIHRIARPDGEIRFIKVGSRTYFDENGKPLRIVGTNIDITDIKDAEENLSKKNEMLESLLKNLQIGVYMIEVPSGKPLLANEASFKLLGRGILPEANSSNITKVYDLYKTDSNEPYPNEELPLIVAMSGESKHIDDMIVVKPDGTRTALEVFGSPIKDEKGNVWASLVSFQDITERKQHEILMTSLSQRLQLATSSAKLGVWDWNVRENIMLWDDRMFELYGITRDTFPNSIDAWMAGLHPEDKEISIAECQAALNGKKEFNTEFRVLHPDGTVMHIRARGLVLFGTDGTAERMLGINYDISELKRAEEEKHILEQQFQQTQKLESLGMLAGGIAHDFNNILAIIMGNCSLARMDSENADNYLPEIEKATDRAAALCRQMLAYAGKAQLAITQINMWLLVDEMINMLKATLPQNAEIKPYLAVDIPHVNGDASQIRQIVMNLIINASEAVGDAQGEIRISLTKTMRTEKQPDKDYHGKTIPPGEYICLEVTDTGCGMDEETKWRIFEPFYTTKFTGRGLGMSAVLGIIMSHKGALQLFTQPSHGTTFRVYLPCGENGAESQIDIAPSELWLGSGTILLAEDEEPIRKLARVLLKKLGFDVIEASNGREALELYQKNAADITLVITDMGMPVMDGYHLFHELKQLAPNLAIIISSGFGDTEVSTRIRAEDIAGSIRKPYNFDQLRDVLKSVVGN